MSCTLGVTVADLLVTFSLVFVDIHGEAERVYGEGKDYGGALLSGNCTQGLKKIKRMNIIFKK